MSMMQEKMDKRKLLFFSSLTICIIVFLLLISGSPILTVPLDSNDSIPLGTFITWVGIVSLPTTIYWGVRKMRCPDSQLQRILSYLLKAALVLAILWVPVSYLLAGNLSFSFTEKETFQGGQQAMRWFWRFSYGVVVIPLLILIASWVSTLFKARN